MTTFLVFLGFLALTLNSVQTQSQCSCGGEEHKCKGVLESGDLSVMTLKCQPGTMVYQTACTKGKTCRACFQGTYSEGEDAASCLPCPADRPFSASGSSLSLCNKHGLRYVLPRRLVPGDEITFTGTHDQTAPRRFAINLETDNEDYVYHAEFRPPGDTKASAGHNIVMNSCTGSSCIPPYSAGWGKSVLGTAACLVNGAKFTVTVKCEQDKFVLYCNGVALNAEFEYRYVLDTVKTISLWSSIKSQGFNTVKPLQCAPTRPT